MAALERLAVRDRYNDNEQVHTASGKGMTIQHIGHATFQIPDRLIHLKNIFHVSQATKSLVSASKLFSDNDSYAEIYPRSFAIKDQASGETFFTARVGIVCILFMALLHQIANKLLVQALHQLGGMGALAIPLLS
jgi:hypothetical protein